MLLFLLTHKLLSGMIWLLIVCGVGIQIMIGVRMQHLLEEMDELSITRDPFLIRCRLCPEGTSPQTHVDRMLESLRIIGCAPTVWKTLSGQAIMLSVVLSGVGVCIGISRGETIGSLLPYYVFCMLGLYAYFAIAGAVDCTGRLEKMREKLYRFLSQKEREADNKNVTEEKTGEEDCTLELVELLDELLMESQ